MINKEKFIRRTTVDLRFSYRNIISVAVSIFVYGGNIGKKLFGFI